MKEQNQAKQEIEALAKLWGIEKDKIKKDGDNLTVGGSLYLSDSQVAALPDNLTVGGNLYLRRTPITALPDNLTVGGDLYLDGTPITALPDNFTVGRDLDLSGTPITALPDNLTVGGNLYLSGTPIAAPKKINRPSLNLSMEIRLSIERKFNARGYTIADNILARVLNTKGNIKKVIVVGKKGILYLVSDENGNSAHGETIEKAREDLIYKAVAKFDGEIPKSATGKEWIGIYRAITGACETGVKLFVERVGKSLDETYEANEICKLVEGQYNAQKFSEKVSGMHGPASTPNV